MEAYMKARFFIPMFFLLAACAHERTEIDRELVLKLADRPQVQVVQAPAQAPQTINLNVNTQPYSGQSVATTSNDYSPVIIPETDPHPYGKEKCMEMPVYNASGVLMRYKQSCF
jgi:hypothetical protein